MTFLHDRWLGMGATLLCGIMAPADLRASDGLGFNPPFVEGLVVHDLSRDLSRFPDRSLTGILGTIPGDGVTGVPLLDDQPKDVTNVLPVRLSRRSGGTTLGADADASVAFASSLSEPEIVAWGSRYNGSYWVPPTAPSGLSDLVAVAAGEHHSLGLLADGRVVAWDVGGAIQPTIERGSSNVVSIAADSSTCLGLTMGGGVLAWDAPGSGEPVEVKGWSNIVAIATGRNHRLALTAAGRVIGLGGPAVPRELSVERPGEFPFHRVMAIAAGYSHSLAVTAEGRVIAWGANPLGQTNVPPGLSNVVAVAAGEYHSLALTAGGTVAAWGKYYNGARTFPMTAPAGLSNVVAIAAGRSHGLALTAGGRVVGWGAYYGGSGMLPMTVPEGLRDVVAIAAMGGHNLALLGSASGPAPPVWIGPRLLVGTVDRAFHQRLTVKNGATSYAASGLPPGLVLDSATGLLSGAPAQPGTYSLALSATNGMGGSTTTATLLINQPVGPMISDPGEQKVIGAGSAFRYQIVAYHEPERFTAVGLPRGLTLNDATGEITGTPVETGDFEVRLTAENRYGVALALFKVRVSGPMLSVPGGWLAIGTGSAFGYQVVADYEPERFTAIGLPRGLIINEATGEIVGAPVENGDYEVRLTAENPYGLAEAVLRLRVSPVLSWDYLTICGGPCGDYFRALRSSPAIMPGGLSNVVAIATGGMMGFCNDDFGCSGAYDAVAHCMALTGDGRVTEWWGGSEQFGNQVPPGLSNVVAIAAGGMHSLALTAEGRVVAWWQTGMEESLLEGVAAMDVPRGLSNVVAIAAGGWMSLALTAEGSVIAWRWSRRAEVPTGLTNVVAIAAGYDHALALTSEGRVVAWGGNGQGQTMAPLGLSNVVAIAAGDSHSLALTSEGRVVAWGNDWAPELIEVQTGLSNVVAIAGGANHSLALTSDGRVVEWGWVNETRPSEMNNAVAIASGGPFYSLVLLRQADQPSPRLRLSSGASGLELEAEGAAGISCQLLRASDLSGPWLPTQAVTFTNRVQTLRAINPSRHTQFFRLLRK